MCFCQILEGLVIDIKHKIGSFGVKVARKNLTIETRQGQFVKLTDTPGFTKIVGEDYPLQGL